MRYFFIANGAVREDPATGSACANLGGWHIATKKLLPLTTSLRQGEAIQRPSRLGLRVDEERAIYVSGNVIEIGRGFVELQEGDPSSTQNDLNHS